VNSLTRWTEVVRHSIEEVIAHLDEQIKQIEKQIAKDIDDDPTLKEQRELLASIPALFLSHYGGQLRFVWTVWACLARWSQTRAFWCPAPQRQPLAGCCRMGHSALRRGLYMPAVVAMTRTPWGQAFASREGEVFPGIRELNLRSESERHGPKAHERKRNFRPKAGSFTVQRQVLVQTTRKKPGAKDGLWASNCAPSCSAATTISRGEDCSRVGSPARRSRSTSPRGGSCRRAVHTRRRTRRPFSCRTAAGRRRVR
jgi:hypothetical protein